MRKLCSLALILVLGITAYAQTEENPLVLRVEDEKVYLDEFLTVYNKNRKDESLDKKEVMNYLDLYLNFKLKVYEAKALGLDTMPDFQRELAGYRKQLAKPYLIDSEVTENLIEEAYERLQEEVRASHILVTLKENALPKDTLEAYRKAISIRNSIVKDGEDFESAALEYSQDPSVESNKGDLGYFTALYMVYPFESAAYQLELNEVSMPVRTRFGYHLIKLTGRRPARGEVKVAHIMIMPENKNDEASFEVAKDKVYEIFQKLNEDPSQFEALARDYSDDKSSSRQGGELNWFGTNVMVEEFEDAAFAIENIGEYTEPIRTDFGYHIIKLIDKKEIQDLETMRYELKQKIERDSRSELSKQSLINRLKKEYNFKSYASRVRNVVRHMDDSYYKAEWDVPASVKSNRILATFADQKITQADLIEMMFQNQVKGAKRLTHEQVVQKNFNNLVEQRLIAYEDSRLEEKYPRFANLMREYEEGILLFELSDKKVWTKAATDSAGLAAYYETISGRFMWPDRIDAAIVSCSSEKYAKKAKKWLKRGKSLDMVKTRLNKTSALNCSVEKGLFSKEDNVLVAGMDWSSDFSSIRQTGNQFKFVYKTNIVPAAPKELRQVRGIVVSEYQAVLEKAWIEELKAKYDWEVNEELIEEITD